MLKHIKTLNKLKKEVLYKLYEVIMFTLEYNVKSNNLLMIIEYKSTYLLKL